MKWNLLVVDDDQERTEQIADWFGPVHYNVYRAHSGPEGLEMARAVRPDIVLLDIVMPEMGGLEVLQHLKGDPATAPIPVVICSFRADDVEGLQTLMKAGFREGADYVVARKWGLPALEQVVVKLLSRTAGTRFVESAGHVLRLGEGCAQVWFDDQPRQLAPLEAAVLEHLYNCGGEASHVEEIAEAIYEGPVDVGSVYKIIGRLRERIEPDPSRPIFVVTVRGHGYKLAMKV
jgi:DNA-binding response OmpR family regulator